MDGCRNQVSAAGLLVCLLASFLSTDLFPVKEEKDIEWVSDALHLVLAQNCSLATPLITDP